MEYRNSKLLAEAQHRLESVLSELGLRAELNNYVGSEHIVFRSADESLRHSVEIMLSDFPRETWDGAYIQVYQMEEIPIGDNGWKHSKFYDPITLKPFNGNAEETFRYIGDCVQKYPVYRVGRTHSDLFDDDEIAATFHKIEEKIRDITNSPISFDRFDGNISISFNEEYSGDLWRMTFSDDLVTLTINGEKVAEIKRFISDDVVALLLDKIDECHIPDLGL